MFKSQGVVYYSENTAEYDLNTCFELIVSKHKALMSLAQTCLLKCPRRALKGHNEAQLEPRKASSRLIYRSAWPSVTRDKIWYVTYISSHLHMITHLDRNFRPRRVYVSLLKTHPVVCWIPAASNWYSVNTKANYAYHSDAFKSQDIVDCSGNAAAYACAS